jgi:hypothetical protein
MCPRQKIGQPEVGLADRRQAAPFRRWRNSLCHGKASLIDDEIADQASRHT